MIVTAYFKIPSKKPHEFYVPHLRKFLSWVRSPILFFTTPDLVDELGSMRPKEFPITFVTYNSVYEIEAFQKYGLDFWKNQYVIDPSRYHTPELCAVWYNKKEFVKKAVDIIGGDEPFIWVDAGCIRHDYWRFFVPTFGQNVNAIPKDKVIIQLMEPSIPKEKEFFIFPDVYVAGAIIAGYKEAWERYSTAYDVIFSKYVKAGVCANMDQFVMASVANAFPDAVEPIYDQDWNDHLDRWFFFLKFLSFS